MATSASKCPNYGSYETIECEETAQTQTELIVRAKRTPFWGRYHTFLFRNGEPLIAFGPHCINQTICRAFVCPGLLWILDIVRINAACR
jgi:hypothetical protein